jgi:glycosyltransferase involved in cell wall biosynthesis
MSPRVRILTVANHLGARGGLERTQLTNCRALAARGHRVDLVYVSPGDFAEEWERFAGTMVRTGGTLPRRRHPIASVVSVLGALRAGRRAGPDAVYVYRYWDIPYAVALGLLARAPVVLHLCLPPPRVVPRWLVPFLGRVDRVLSVSQDTAALWEGTGLRAERTSVVLTGIDLARYAPAPAPARSTTRRSLGIVDDGFVVLYAGRIGREKGVDVLVRAWAEMAATEPGGHLVVVGSPSLGADPADSARYQAELRELATGLAVTWVPAQRDVLALIQAADVAVAPSLWPEPLSRSVMEPLACGVPVVATNVGGNPEILTGWLSHYLVEPHDVSGLAERISSLRRWRQLDPDLGERCRREAETRLSLEAEVDAVEAAIGAAIENGPRAGHRRSRRWRANSPSDATSWG